jgi:hypothetical protein
MATQPNVRNIIVGAAAFFVSANTSQTGDPVAALPTLVASTSATATLQANASWRDIGYTTNGLELSYEPDFGEIAVDQLLDAARLFKQGQKVMLKTEFAEASLENLFVVMNQTTGYNTVNAKQTTSTSGVDIQGVTNAVEIQGGTLGDYPVERSIVAVGPGPRPTSGNNERVYYASRAMSMDASAHGLKRDSGTFFPVSFRLLPVASTSNAYGKIIDRSY